MGAGTSGLYFGTRGSRQDYQFSLFPDIVRKDSAVQDMAEIVSTGSKAYTTRSNLGKQVITVEMVLEKCNEFHNRDISATQLVQWLTTISTSPYYRLVPSELKEVVRSALNSFEKIDLPASQNETVRFNIVLNKLEQKLHQILKKA